MACTLSAPVPCGVRQAQAGKRPHGTATHPLQTSQSAPPPAPPPFAAFQLFSSILLRRESGLVKFRARVTRYHAVLGRKHWPSLLSMGLPHLRARTAASCLPTQHVGARRRRFAARREGMLMPSRCRFQRAAPRSIHDCVLVLCVVSWALFRAHIAPASPPASPPRRPSPSYSKLNCVSSGLGPRR